ncbi:unnamed protein product [Cylicocyclus nassatus]|uniref:Large ribosomal subunit protein mL38 n=1 Tax=Cylicocyclus nassatus TaxID=53992 RepID=A0AA36GKK1_CYLNA|nr:unnamed protein product [Cylicocyclus nassatus]
MIASSIDRAEVTKIYLKNAHRGRGHTNCVPCEQSHVERYVLTENLIYKAECLRPTVIPGEPVIHSENYHDALCTLFQSKVKVDYEKSNAGFKRRCSNMYSAIEDHPTKKPVISSKEKHEKADLQQYDLIVDPDTTNFETLAVLNHYKIFEHLFGPGVFFENVQSMDVAFGENGVYYGNTLLAKDAQTQPQVGIESIKPGGYNTLLMLNLDGNPYEKEGPITHWFVANIPDGKGVDEGEEIVNYVQPLPFYGTGYHRVVFLLFRHNQKLNSSLTLNSKSLDGRILQLSRFYKDNEDIITPSSVLFFQTCYDDSVRLQLHEMGLKSPLYEYKYNEPLKPEQKEFPKRPQPFDMYLDMYRDPKEVEKELLEERLKRAQLDDYQAPKWLDPNYNENKKNLPAWQHRRILAREVHKVPYSTIWSGRKKYDPGENLILNLSSTSESAELPLEQWFRQDSANNFHMRIPALS